MASTNKTSQGLSQWVSTDKPERGDFNSDNLIVDQSLSSLITRMAAAETVLTELSGSSEGGQSNIVTGTYLGTGALEYTVELGFRPRFALVFGADQPIVNVNFTTSQAGIYAAIVSEHGCSSAELAANGFTV